jgi:hypothetical protein
MLFLTVKYVLTNNKFPCGKFYLIILAISNILNNNMQYFRNIIFIYGQNIKYIWITYGNIWALTMYMSIVGFELWFQKLETKFL